MRVGRSISMTACELIEDSGNVRKKQIADRSAFLIGRADGTPIIGRATRRSGDW
jgi:hypothetical protein